MQIAIDPGLSGGIATRDSTGRVRVYAMPSTEGDLLALLTRISALEPDPVAYVERITGFMRGIRASPKSMLTFGRNIGAIALSLQCADIPRVDVVPATWQKAVGVGSKGRMGSSEWKRKLKEKAQALYPGLDGVTLKTADALLILWWAGRSDSLHGSA